MNSPIPVEDDLLARLLSLADSERQTLLLAVDRQRVSRRSPAHLRREAQGDLVAPCSVPQTVLHALDGLAYGCLPAGTETIALSPVAPFGAHHALGGNPQDNVLGTIRRAEILGDPTVPLALAIAARRQGAEVVRLATSHRVMRLQPRKSPGHTAHFQLFALATGGRDEGSEQFELSSLREHLGFYLAWLAALAAAGWRVGDIAVRLSDMRVVRALCASYGVDLQTMRQAAAEEALAQRGLALPLPTRHPEDEPSLPLLEADRHRIAALRARVIEPLERDHPQVAFAFDFGRLRQATYYPGLCFHVDIDGFPFGKTPVADGGFVDWTARLLSNRKERLLTSGLGTELLARALPREP